MCPPNRGNSTKAANKVVVPFLLYSWLKPVTATAPSGQRDPVPLGREGWPHVEYRSSGPNPMSAWSRIEVGWITPVTVTADMLDVRIHNVNSTNGRVFRLPVSSSEYFLVANRQNGHPTVGSYYDALAPTSGLAIWHVDENVPGTLDANYEELHKRVDLECADGLFSDRGYPGTMPDAVAGRDNLDFWATDSTYRANHNGSNDRGDATDLWNGSAGDLTTDTAFTPYTNPSTAGYHDNGTSGLDDDRQSVRTGIAVRVTNVEDATWTWERAVGGTGVSVPDGQFW